MGIKGLWQALRDYVDDGHLSQFRGQRVAVDMYVWLHRCVHRSVRIRTEAILAFLDAKYGGTVGSEGSEPPGSGGDASTQASPSPALLSVDDVLEIDEQFITLVVDKVSALQRFGVTPVCVFDGAEMPMKGGTDEERQRRRTDAFQAALVKLEQLYCDTRRNRGYAAEHHASGSRIALPRGTRLYEEALQLLEKAVDISTELAHAVIQVLKEERHVECIVAPYEADAQLAYLCRQGYVAAAASEDSDLIAYFCPCIIAKLDTFSGKCEVLQPPLCAPHFFRRMATTSGTTPSTAALLLKSVSASRRAAPADDAIGYGPNRENGPHTRMRAAALQSLQRSRCFFNGEGGTSADEGAAATAASTAFTYESFLLGCILSGCDYVPNLRSIGVKKAFKLVAHARSLRQCFATLEREFGFPADELRRYRHRILEAFYCFAHHLVYSPLSQEIVTYYPLPGSSGSGGTAALKTQLVGDRWPAHTAQEVCVQCLKDPCTLQLYRGIYQACVTQYLQRTRRGQTSLRAYTGFQEMSSNRVVMRLEKQRRDESAILQCSADKASFGAPLKRQRVATGFVGRSAAPSQSPSSLPQQPARAAVVVRSQFFIMHGRTAVRERWSASETDSEEDTHNGGRGQRVVMPGRTSFGPEDHMVDMNASDGHPLASPAHLPSSPASLSTTKAASGSLTEDSASGSLTEDSASGTGAAVAAISRLIAGRTEEEEAPWTRQGGSTGDCARLDDAVEGLPNTSWTGGGDATASVTSPLFTNGSALSTEDSESTRDGGHELVAEYRAARAPAVRRGPHKAFGVADTSDVESCTCDTAQGASAAAEAVGTQAASSAPSPPRCSCPFGYWQCNRAHSVFESCFLRRHWLRDEGPPQSLSPGRPTARACALTADSSTAPRQSSTAGSVQQSVVLPAGHATTGYVPRAFRPPRSTAASSTPSSSASGKSPPLPMQLRPMKAQAADLTVLRPPLKAQPLTAAPLTSPPLSVLPSPPADGDRASSAASASLPSDSATTRMTIFDKMSFKKG
ncbi:hypothetical protein LSCM1_06144 [Leishmania martiniquensis]|uniref:Exonuclease 1 n=1 Tax=Leishmania martiniquensis TaxID=1580590 RepID=A0A836H6Y6_9TRYP|nr:hypothetical protein LSCM1_06144 [Leishmania martiniquensis]